MKKISELELLRGGGIILVVFAHISFHYNTVLLQRLAIFFVMPLFFSISGFLFGYKDISYLNTWREKRKIIAKKVISLGIPYFLFSVIYIILFSFFNKYIDTNNTFELKNIFFILYSPVAQYWYIWTLLVFFLISFVILQVNNLRIVFGISVLLNLLWYVFYSDADLNVYSKTIIFYMYFVGATFLGQLYAKNNYTTVIKKKRTQYILVVLLAIFIVTSYLRVSQNSNIGMGYSALQLLNTFCGIFGFLFIMYNVSRVKILKKAILVIADYSWYIYILHSYFTSFSKTLLIRVYPNIDIYSYFVISFLFTIIGCILIGYFSKKISFIDFLFYPQKYLGLSMRGEHKED